MSTRTADESREFDMAGAVCPRCRQSLGGAEYYGVCPACCAELRESQVGEDRTVEAAAYEPKMNVTPNAVASKE